MSLTKQELDEFTEDFLSEDDGDSHIPEVELNYTDVNDSDADSPEDVVEETQNVSDGSDLWDKSTDEQRGEVSRLQSQLALAESERETFRHAADSDRGRHKALHAKAESLQNELSSLKAKQVDVSDDSSEDDDNSYTKEELSELSSDLPEVAALIRSETGALKREITELRSQQPAQVDVPQAEFDEGTAPPQQQYQQEVDQNFARNQAIAEVKAVHPDFEDVRRNPSYATWLSRSAPGVRGMASSNNSGDAITLLDMFKASRKTVDHSDELDSLTDIPRKGAARSGLEGEDDFDTAFEHFGNIIEEERSSH